MKRFMLTSVISAVIFAASAVPPLQQPCSGRIDRLYVYSPQMTDTIPVDVWLPDCYVADSTTGLPVVYMHDGQNLYDATTTWNHQSWEIDSVVTHLIDIDSIRPVIVVGIHSFADTRVGDLFPQRAGEEAGIVDILLDNPMGVDEMRGSAYAAFMVETLKPLIDNRYNTISDRSNTTVMGSSMGGLMSLYALCEYPEVFGNAGCLSTHWVGFEEGYGMFAAAMRDYIRRHLPHAGSHKLYFDLGTETTDAKYGESQEIMMGEVRAKDYRDGVDLLTGFGPGDAHEERAWARRVHPPLLFFLRK